MTINLCNHRNRIGDNYGESCYDCGKQLSGYGYGGWFGRNLTKQTCIHLWSPCGNMEVCIYCESMRPLVYVNPDNVEAIAKRIAGKE